MSKQTTKIKSRAVAGRRSSRLRRSKKFLDFLVTTPRLSRAAEHVGIHHKTPFEWIARSMRNDPEFEVVWMGRKAQFAKHIIVARELSKAALDHSARDMGINGWRELKTGPHGPIWKVDPKIAADAMTMTELDWELEYWPRKRDDVYLRDENGALVQDWIDHPPNPQLLNKLLGSLLKEVYGDHSTVEHVGSVGHVWIGGETMQSATRRARSQHAGRGRSARRLRHHNAGRSNKATDQHARAAGTDQVAGGIRRQVHAQVAPRSVDLPRSVRQD